MEMIPKEIIPMEVVPIETIPTEMIDGKKKRKKTFFKYSEDDMKEAIAAVKQGMNLLAASKKFNVPRSTLFNKITEKSPEIRKMGPQNILTKYEEEGLVLWIKKIARAGFTLIKEDLLVTVQKIMEDTGRQNPFTNNKPGRHWFERFARRHPELPANVREPAINPRANTSEKKIRSWFCESEKVLKEDSHFEILQNPNRIFSFGELSFQLCSETGTVLGPKGDRMMYDTSMGSEKSCLTVSLTVCANGVVLPPFIVYPYVKVPQVVLNNIPDNWASGKIQSGSMMSENFYEYITTVFYPWLVINKVELPIVLFLDGHKPHITMHLSNFCEGKIVLAALPANASSVIQPCYTSVFSPLKTTWRNMVYTWTLENHHDSITTTNFALLFREVVSAVNTLCVKNGFQSCGIHPWDPNAVDYTRCKHTVVESEQLPVSKVQLKPAEFRIGLKCLDALIDPDTLASFEGSYENGRSWDGPERSAELYAIWWQIKSQVLP